VTIELRRQRVPPAAGRRVPTCRWAVTDVAQVDQVELRVLDDGPAQVGLANLLIELDALALEIIDVDPGAASLAGDWSAHPAASGRAKVNARAPQVSVAQVSPRPPNLG
jgi:hypothetical protein